MIGSGYAGQFAEWVEVITGGKTSEECCAILKDALHEMTLAYRQRNKWTPVGQALLDKYLSTGSSLAQRFIYEFSISKQQVSG
jgi:predicted RNase H-like HicB family nuclease